MQINNKISFYGKHLPKAGLTSLLLNKGAATHFITYESHFVGSAAITQIVKWSSVAVAGLGTYDAVSGATQITQIAPSSGSSTVPAKAGELLNLVYQITGAPHRPRSWEVSGQIPPGVTHLNTKNSNTDGLTGIPTRPGTYKVFVTAYKGSNLNGYSYTKTFTIEVTPGSEPPVISNHPLDTKVTSVNETTLEVGVTGENVEYQWYKGESGVTSAPVDGANDKFLKIGPLREDSKYWVQISNDSGSVNSQTANVKVVDNYTSWAEQQLGLDAELNDPKEDNDGDGLTNEYEYLIGSSPVKQSVDSETEISVEDSLIKLAFMTKSAQGDGYAGLERVYSVEESNDISKDSWKAVPGYQNVVGNGQKISLTKAINDVKKYYRLKVNIREKS